MNILDLLPRKYRILFLLLELTKVAICQPYFGFDPRVPGPPLPPQPPMFPLQNSYVPNQYGVAPPDYVFASYTQGGFKFQGPAPEAEESEESDESGGDQGPPGPATTFGDTPAGPGFGYSSDADEEESSEGDENSGGGRDAGGQASLKSYRQKVYQYMRNVMAQRRVK